KREAAFVQRSAGAAGLLAALLRQIDVGPAGEAILAVPDTLSMTEKNEFVHPRISKAFRGRSKRPCADGAVTLPRLSRRGPATGRTHALQRRRRSGDRTRVGRRR